MLITNENDVTSHFGNALLPDKNVPWHNATYMRKAEDFANANRLPKDVTWRSWEHGPAKLFLNDLERQFHQRMIEHLRGLGVQTLLATTSQWGGNTLASLPALTAGDLVDGHAYGGVGELERDPAYGPTLVHWLAASQVAGKPFTVTEWNVPFPAPDRHTAPLYVAASAAHQGWAAVMHYAYSQVPQDSAGSPGEWESFNDPSLIATLAAGALMYRRADVSPAVTTYVFAPSRNALYFEPTLPTNAVALRTAAEKGRLLIGLPATPELPWLRAGGSLPGAQIITDANEALLAADASAVASDTGELRRDWSLGTYTINTPRTKAATGWLGGKTIQIGSDLVIKVNTPYASVVVQSLTASPVAQSNALMISLAARAAAAASAPFTYRSEPVEGELAIRAPAGLKLQAVLYGGRRKDVPVNYSNGQYVVRLGELLGSYWLVLAG
jgi:hypothetical protein